MQIYLPEVKAKQGEAVSYLFSDFGEATPDNSFDADSLEVRVSVSWVGEEVMVIGSLTASTETACSRCLARFRYEFRTEFREAFRVVSPEPHPVNPEELAAETAEKLTVRGEYLYLAEYIRQLVILAREYSPLCRADCRGICAGCGADLNNEPCTCDAGDMAVDSRLIKLKELKSGSNVR